MAIPFPLLIYSHAGHGFVFRVDLALRPNGNSGPPAVSLGALEEYFHVSSWSPWTHELNHPP